MAVALQFSGVNCGKISGLTFALDAGTISVLRLAGKEEKLRVIELAVNAARAELAPGSQDTEP